MNDVVLFRLSTLRLARVVTVLLYRVKCKTGRAQVHMSIHDYYYYHFDISLITTLRFIHIYDFRNVCYKAIAVFVKQHKLEILFGYICMSMCHP